MFKEAMMDFLFSLAGLLAASIDCVISLVRRR